MDQAEISSGAGPLTSMARCSHTDFKPDKRRRAASGYLRAVQQMRGGGPPWTLRIVALAGATVMS